jgi:hypothetical protein
MHHHAHSNAIGNGNCLHSAICKNVEMPFLSPIWFPEALFADLTISVLATGVYL